MRAPHPRIRRRIDGGGSSPSPFETLLAIAAGSPAIAGRLAGVCESPHPVAFDLVAEPAQPFVAAVVARHVRDREATPGAPGPGALWVLCRDLRHQEAVFDALSTWVEDAVFFPELELAAHAGALPDPEIEAERFEVLRRLADPGVRPGLCVVLTARSLGESVPAPDALRRGRLAIEIGQTVDRAEITRRLAGAGYERVRVVGARGQYAVRGGILDVFSWQHADPVRIEFADECVDSIREFDIDRQISTRPLSAAEILSSNAVARAAPLREWMASGDIRVGLDSDGDDHADVLIRHWAAPGIEDARGAFVEIEGGRLDPGDLVMAERKRERLLAQLVEWSTGGWTVVVFCESEGERERLAELLGAAGRGAALVLGAIPRGFLFPAGKLAVLSDAELFGRYQAPRARHLARARAGRYGAPLDPSALEEGALVVHADQGIGRYLGLVRLPPGGAGAGEDVLAIEYAGDARLYVPLTQAHLVTRHVGLGRRRPALSKLGDGRWARTKAAAARSVEGFALRLLSVQAERLALPGHAFGRDEPWQGEFERAFPHRETPDQLRAIRDVKADMESARPMDRLICGDVGFGKTEVAVRAAFKAVMGGKQVAVLAPTTVLAQQHYRTLRERMSDYPVTIEMLSRFRTPGETRRIVDRLRDGSVDIVVATHRLLSPDVEFRELGLVVIDEEQRFGVADKERLKERFRRIDQITLSATPIPRTLYLSLMGARDLSTIETPPPNRYPVETTVCAYDERVIRDALRRELDRGGQVFFLHNRVRTIGRVRDRLAELCPAARIAIGHGQMAEGELETVMGRFVDGTIDVLVATTIIENGLDIPNANTIVIDRADRFGLADLYQLRGRVGRAQHKAYAYLLLPRDLVTVGAARRRVSAIRQHSALGAGFKVAMRDLEIRGAGTLLGPRQSGHASAVGFELYCRLLRVAVARVKGAPLPEPPRVDLALDFVVRNEGEHAPGIEGASARCLPAFLPAAYVEGSDLRLAAYRAVAEAAVEEDVERLNAEWRDRFGPPPEAACNLLGLTRLRIAAERARVTRVETRGARLLLTRDGDLVTVGGRFPRLTSPDPKIRFGEILSILAALP